MKYPLAVLAGVAALSTTALAQSAPMSNSSTPPAVVTSKGDSNTTAAPVAGENSFTKTQARERLEKHGYSQVSDLQKDDKSVWRGTAVKDGKTVNVSLDYQGNISAQ